ncbi:hypothetical protein ZIOFF_026842 [Zingiber officinale]|uniref:Retrovirus-related Pol polyprotein from transposon TNT 1-94-like beta-barrel domain-containing protein n=1 Tax=Zingiber officinale TaxID=94328 RepID=A0A8J5GWX4_ZINOF|nr:hypothetical protein ZIOFF_026842 [Zingiber officinale]
MNHLPDTRKVHVLILQHERQSDIAANRNNSGHVVNFAQPKTQNRIGSRQVIEAESHHLTGNNRLYCTNSEMDGYTIDRCFYIHGFPPGHRYHGKDIKPKGKKSINSSVVPNMERSETKKLTTKEYDQIMALIHKDIGNTEPLINTSGIDSIYASSTWILGSGAIDHVCNTPPTTIKFFSKHVVVQPPNGGHAEIKSIGSKKLSNNMTVENILYVPKFKLNLLSISKLTQTLGCKVTFYPDSCVMQDLTTKKTIGLSKQSNGLY